MRRRGFSLVELVVALSVFAIAMVMVTSLVLATGKLTAGTAGVGMRLGQLESAERFVRDWVAQFDTEEFSLVPAGSDENGVCHSLTAVREGYNEVTTGRSDGAFVYTLTLQDGVLTGETPRGVRTLAVGGLDRLAVSGFPSYRAEVLFCVFAAGDLSYTVVAGRRT